MKKWEVTIRAKATVEDTFFGVEAATEEDAVRAVREGRCDDPNWTICEDEPVEFNDEAEEVTEECDDASPTYKVYDERGNYVGETVKPADSGNLLIGYGTGATIRTGDDCIVFRQGTQAMGSDGYVEDMGADRIGALIESRE